MEDEKKVLDKKELDEKQLDEVSGGFGGQSIDISILEQPDDKDLNGPNYYA